MSEQKSGNKKPNILFIIADDHRSDSIGVYGNPHVRTPNLDRLAAEGVLFQSVYTMGGQTAALCVPCRASLLTGANAFRSTVSNKEVTLAETEDRSLWELNPALAILPEVLRQEGYRTFGTGKWHNGKAAFARSFSDGANIFFGGMGDHVGLPVHGYDLDGIYPQEAAQMSSVFSSELFAETASDFIQSYESDEPFFLYVAFTAPHDPRTPPPGYSELYSPEGLPLPGNFMTEHPFDNGELQVRDEQLAVTPRQPEEIRRHLADYYSMITHMDEQIGRILHTLEASGRADDTIVVYTADHGLALGQHGLLGKQNLYEHSVHIPLVMRGPGLPQAAGIEALGCQIDIFPTLCDLTGISCPQTAEGRSLAPLLLGQAAAVRENVFAAYKSLQRMVRDDRWKLIRYYRSGGGGSERTQLFDLQADPWEVSDLSGESAHEPHLRRLEAQLLQWQRNVGDPLLIETAH
ncbi:sulfatase-like hydrolase/transferase [Paenibacillus thalictri]|uniref:DUF4976 domain-containing protein n=1 Tax=Paenibacillus thalictri TaxID=2527873 RepID=A0A4Q9DLK7_9BACL|nr:sulfatase-like hydrolase/transferase [Paenibacillus thalictri]TBL75310.1 DUF4976 domain-containing protein [Paenibacillus thalictri]